MKVSDVLDAIQTYAEPELEALMVGISPVLAAVPLAALLKLADDLAKTIEAKNELEAMRNAVKAADQAADDAEAAASGTPLGKLP